jgi:hypothetical protein
MIFHDNSDKGRGTCRRRQPRGLTVPRISRAQDAVLDLICSEHQRCGHGLKRVSNGRLHQMTATPNKWVRASARTGSSFQLLVLWIGRLGRLKPAPTIRNIRCARNYSIILRTSGPGFSPDSLDVVFHASSGMPPAHEDLLRRFRSPTSGHVLVCERQQRTRGSRFLAETESRAIRAASSVV